MAKHDLTTCRKYSWFLIKKRGKKCKRGQNWEGDKLEMKRPFGFSAGN